MMFTRSAMDRLKAQYTAEGCFGPASDLLYLPDDLLMEEYDAALLGRNHGYALEDCAKEAVRRGLIEKPACTVQQVSTPFNVAQFLDLFTTNYSKGTI